MKLGNGGNNKEPGKLLLPAVKGKMGNREYILCLMPAEEVAKRVMLAVEITSPNANPSQRLQRDVDKSRISDIVKYLKKEDRFFNAFVVAICGDDAKWRSFSELSGDGIDQNKHKDALGFLSLSGKEKMYALDGQHRLQGIQKAIDDEGVDEIKDDMISILMVHHDENRVQTGLAESRRLFTVLNKYAQKPAKRDIIYLDEDDVGALVVRNLVETEQYADLFELKKRIHESPANQFHANDKTTCFTTIGVFYDCIIDLISTTEGISKKDLTKQPASLDKVTKYSDLIYNIFTEVRNSVPEMKSYFNIKNNQQDKLMKFIEKNNKRQSLFRPMGLKYFIQTLCAYYKHAKKSDKTIEECVELCCQLPFDMHQPPLSGLVWNTKENKVLSKGYSTLKKIYLYMIGLALKNQDSKILEEYRKAVKNDTTDLPTKLVSDV